MSTNSRVLSALLTISSTQARIIASPSIPASTNALPSSSRRASVALIIRLRPKLSAASTPSPSTANSTAPPSPSDPSAASVFPSLEKSTKSVQLQLQELFAQSWVRETTTAEVLFIKRATRAGDRWSGDVALPGGKSELDETGQYTAMRETWEEVGVDLDEPNWLCVGNLDDREITTSLGKRLLMILSTYVFINTSPYSPSLELQGTEIASAHWIPFDILMPPQAQYGTVGIDISSRLAPRSPLAQVALRLLVGSMYFRCILLPNDPTVTIDDVSALPVAERADLRLWGLTLGLILDVLSKMSLPASSLSPPPANLSTYPHAILDLPPMSLSSTLLSSSLASIFPRFSFPDINLLIYLFGWRYRRLLTPVPSSSSNSLTASPSIAVSLSSSILANARIASAGGEGDRAADQRVTYAGVALGSYYAAVRKALMVAVVLRAITAASGIGWIVWWSLDKLKQRRGRAVGV